VSTLERLRQQMLASLDKARAICDAANGDSRDFSARERKEVAAHLAEARGFKAQFRHLENEGLSDADRKARQKAGDDALTKEILALGAGDDMGPATAWAGGRPYQGGGAAVSGAWSKAFLGHRARQDPFGSKQLVTPSGAIGVPQLSAVLPAVGERLESILQVLPTETTSNASIEFLRETTRVHEAAPVAEGATKPTSTYELEELVRKVEVIAHLTPSSPRHWFKDAPGLQRYLDTVLRLGVQLALEDQVINGTGTSPQLEGMLSVAGHLVQGWDGVDILSTSRRAITLLELLSIPTDGLCYVLHPNDWEAAELLEASDSGAYKMNVGDGRAPVNRQARRLWGVQVALSVATPEGTGLLFDRRSVQLYEREAIELSWSENVYDSVSGTTDFERNLLKWRCEGRWCLVIYKPDAIVEIDLGLGS